MQLLALFFFDIRIDSILYFILYPVKIKIRFLFRHIFTFSDCDGNRGYKKYDVAKITSFSYSIKIKLVGWLKG